MALLIDWHLGTLDDINWSGKKPVKLCYNYCVERTGGFFSPFFFLSTQGQELGGRQRDRDRQTDRQTERERERERERESVCVLKAEIRLVRWHI